MKLTGAFVLLLVVLTACVNVPAKGERISGRMVFALHRDVVTQWGFTEDEFLEQMTDNVRDNASFNTPLSIDPEKGSVIRRRYQDSRFLGVMFKFWNVPLKELNGSLGNVNFSLRHENGNLVLKVTADHGEKGLLRGDITEELARSAQVRFKFTFPGEVLESNGEADKHSAIWRPNLTEYVEMTATARDHGPAATLRWVIYGIGFLIVLALATEIALRAWRRRRLALGAVKTPNADATEVKPPVT